ncbi:hypothetical protein BDR07DRAFT_1616793 [Suillus spraguei]|nr:hypothetical protein BDR07DRAFT_1616793 [Suillus spraguei]
MYVAWTFANINTVKISYISTQGSKQQTLGLPFHAPFVVDAPFHPYERTLATNISVSLCLMLNMANEPLYNISKYHAVFSRSKHAESPNEVIRLLFFLRAITNPVSQLASKHSPYELPRSLTTFIIIIACRFARFVSRLDATRFPVAAASSVKRSFEPPSPSNTPGTPSETPSQTETPPGDTYAVYNPFPGPYRPELGAAHYCVTNKALPFFGVDSVDREFGCNASPNTSASNVPNNNASTTNTNSNTNSSTTGWHTAKRRRDSFTTGSGTTSAGTSSSSRRSTKDFPYSIPTLFRENSDNTFSLYYSSNGGSAKCSLQFVQLPMLPEAARTSDGHAPQLHQLPPRRPLC